MPESNFTCDLRYVAKVFCSGPSCHSWEAQPPDTELFVMGRLWRYCPVSMLDRLGQQTGVFTKALEKVAPPSDRSDVVLFSAFNNSCESMKFLICV